MLLGTLYILALLFLYGEVFKLEIGGVDAIHTKRTQSMLTVLTKPEAIAFIKPCEGIHHLVTQFPYSNGLHLIEGLRLRVKMSVLPSSKS